MKRKDYDEYVVHRLLAVFSSYLLDIELLVGAVVAVSTPERFYFQMGGHVTHIPGQSHEPHIAHLKTKKEIQLQCLPLMLFHKKKLTLHSNLFSLPMISRSSGVPLNPCLISQWV